MPAKSKRKRRKSRRRNKPNPNFIPKPVGPTEPGEGVLEIQNDGSGYLRFYENNYLAGDDDFIDDDPDDDFLNMDADSFESGPPLPKKRKKKRTSRSSRSSDYSSGGSTYTSSGTGSGFGDSAGTIGTGILMMVGAVVWFVVGFFCGIIFFYPPILFILGLVQVFRGLFSSGD